METQKITPGKYAINYGLILGGVMIAISIFMYATDMAFKQQQWPMYIYYVVFPVVIIMALVSYKKHGAGYLSIGEALKLGLAIAAISAIVNILYGFLFNYVIDPEYNQKVMDFSIDLIANSDAPVEQKEMQRKNHALRYGV